MPSKVARQLLSANIFIPFLVLILLIIDIPSIIISIIIPTPFTVSTSCKNLASSPLYPPSSLCWTLPLKYSVQSVSASPSSSTLPDGSSPPGLTLANLSILRPPLTSISDLTALDLILPTLKLQDTTTVVLKHRGKKKTSESSSNLGMKVYQPPSTSTYLPSLLTPGYAVSETVLVQPSSVITSLSLLLLPGPRYIETETVTTATVLGILKFKVKATCTERVHAKVFKGKGDKVDISNVTCQVWEVTWKGR